MRPGDLCEVHPEISVKDRFDKDHPKGIKMYERWIPMILLIPGLHLETNNLTESIEIKEGVQIFNGVLIDNQVIFQHKYSIKDICSWLENAVPICLICYS